VVSGALRECLTLDTAAAGSMKAWRSSHGELTPREFTLGGS